MAKKLQIKTKLTDRDASEKPGEKLNLVKADTTYPRSYRWRDYELKLIESLVAKVNEVSNKKTSFVKYVKGVYGKGVKLSKKTHEKLETMIEKVTGIEKWAVDIPCY